MDPKLAELYGTNQPMEDVEKLAAAELAENLAGENDVNLADLDADEIEALAREVLSAEAPAGGEEKVAEAEEEATEKVAEADYLGRVMAHAYHQEMRKIASDDAKKSVKEKLKGFGHKAKAQAGAAFGKAKGKAQAGAGKAKAFAMKHPKKMMGAAGAGIAAGGFLAGRKSKQSSEASALDTLAQERALEILAENGIDPNAVEKTSADDKHEALAAAVEARAFEMLTEAGYVETEETPEAAE